jgi:hypothetical protein
MGEIALAIYLEDQSSAGSTVVSRAWVQTWLGRSFRQDRAVFRLTTTQKSLDLLVPAGVNPADVELWLDGKRVNGQPTPELKLIIALTGGESPREHELEAIYRFAGERSETGRMSLELPRLAREVWVHRLYWQVAMPRNEHIVGSPIGFAGEFPVGFAGEFRWGWNGLFWGRIPVLEQPQLETWVGARHLAELPVEANRYLFSSLGSVSRCEVQTVDRTLAVFTASAAALVIGLLLVYVPAVRHPASLLVLAVALVAAVLAWPGPSLLLAQASGLGVVLSLGAAWLHQSVLRRHRRAAAREVSSSILERGSSKTPRRAAALGSDAATEVMQDMAAVSTTDSEP